MDLLQYCSTYFNYCPTSGKITLKAKRSANERVRIGEEVGNISRKGVYARRVVYIKSRNYMVHHIAWIMAYGELPSNEIDHINGNPLDNSINNLRQVDRTTNMRNQKKHVSNTSGVTGVYFHKHSQSWMAQIIVNGKVIYLGSSKTDFDKVVSLRKEAEKRYGFTGRN